MPNCVGVDIGCGVDADRSGIAPPIRLGGFGAFVRETIPAGFHVHRVPAPTRHLGLLEEVGEI